MNKVYETTSYFGSMADKGKVKVSDLIPRYVDSNHSGDFAEWLEKVELVAELQGIDKLETFLPLFLEGPAFSVYKQLGESTKKTYTELKDALLKAFGASSFHAYEQLMNRRLMDGETVDVFLADLVRLTTLIGLEKAEPLIRCAFVLGLPSEVACHVRSVMAVETLTMAALVERTRSIMTNRVEHSIPCAVGIKKRTERICYRCGTGGHLAHQCSKESLKVKTCFICGKPGHFARQCPQRQGNDAGDVLALDASPKTQ